MTNTTEDKGGTMAEPGQKPRITLSDVEAVFEKRDDVAEPLTATEVSEELNCTRRTALTKLQTLHENDAVETKKVGGRARVWWVRVDRGDLEGGSVETGEHRSQRREATEELFYDVDLPGSGENLEGRREALRDIHSYLKEHGKGQRSDFKDLVDVEATGYNDFNSFWTNCITVPGVLAELPDVAAPGEGGHTYRYVGG